MRRPLAGRGRRRLWLSGAFGVSSLLVLNSCASLGGNVRGSFSCAAPDGICAPSSMIDDRALALISADPSDGSALPVVEGHQPMQGRTSRAAPSQPARLASADTGRTQEKVLRIVFQPYIDERGRLHEASAVHAVVARGEWQPQALMQDVVPVGRVAGRPAPTESLASAVDRAGPPGVLLPYADLDSPDPAAVAAARARKPGPVPVPVPKAVAATKTDDRPRLSPKVPSTSGSGTAAALSHSPPAAVSPVLHPPSGASTGGSPEARVPAGGRDAGTANAPGASAVARVKADPRYQDVTNGIAQGAHDASAAQTRGATAPAAMGATVKAKNFPAAVPEDK